MFIFFFAKVTSPASACSFPVTIDSCVVFPAPFTPTSPTRSPFLQVQVTSFSTCWFLNVMDTFSILKPLETPPPPRSESLEGSAASAADTFCSASTAFAATQRPGWPACRAAHSAGEDGWREAGATHLRRCGGGGARAPRAAPREERSRLDARHCCTAVVLAMAASSRRCWWVGRCAVGGAGKYCRPVGQLCVAALGGRSESRTLCKVREDCRLTVQRQVAGSRGVPVGCVGPSCGSGRVFVSPGGGVCVNC
mmetsp:Transcript_29131/g.74720  ORF Transcript_29131/g.74720 Transcript_29131/m.74720 type:complete len:252 (+) Transcript_29131:202-957(+)